jgi:hypothetical protein
LATTVVAVAGVHGVGQCDERQMKNSLIFRN